MSIEKPADYTKRFSPDTVLQLYAQNYKVYELTDQSIRFLQEANFPFWSTWHQNFPNFESMTSRISEVAVNLENLFLPNSNNQSLTQHEKIIEDFSTELQIPGVTAILGEAIDYIELAFVHLNETDERIFGERFDYKYTRTTTHISSGNFAVTGNFHSDRGIHVYPCYKDYGHELLYVAPLIIPI